MTAQFFVTVVVEVEAKTAGDARDFVVNRLKAFDPADCWIDQVEAIEAET